MARSGVFHANPYSALDAEGRPAGRYQLDPDLAGGNLRFIGAEIDAARTVITQKARPELGIYGRQTTIMKYWGEPVSLPITQHHAMGVRTGDLIAGDKETWVACGMPADAFVEPKQALEKAREAAIARWMAAYGESPALIDDHEPKLAKVPALKTPTPKKES